MREWTLPLQPAERNLFLWRSWREFNLWGAKTPIFSLPAFPVSRQRCVLSASRKVNQKLFRSFSANFLERYDVVKRMTLADPQLTRPILENTIRSAYSRRKAHGIAKQGPATGAPAESPNRMLLSSAVGLGTEGAREAEPNERTTV